MEVKIVKNFMSGDRFEPIEERIETLLSKQGWRIYGTHAVITVPSLRVLSERMEDARVLYRLKKIDVPSLIISSWGKQ